MLELLLKAHKPEKYKERVSNEHSGPDGKSLNPPQIVVITGAADDGDKG
jgi:hypothetical protein